MKVLEEFEEASEEETDPVTTINGAEVPEYYAFNEYVARAKRRRRNPVAYIEEMTAKAGTPWTYLGEGDARVNTNWRVG